MPENIVRCIDLGKNPRTFDTIHAQSQILPANHTVQHWVDQLTCPLPVFGPPSNSNAFRPFETARILGPHPSTHTRIRKVSSPASTRTKSRRSKRLQRHKPANIMAPIKGNNQLPHRSADKKSAHDTTWTMRTRGRAAMRSREGGNNKENQMQDLELHSDQCEIGDPFRDKPDLSYGSHVSSRARLQPSPKATSPMKRRGQSRSPSRNTTQRSRTRSPRKQPSGISASGSSPSKSSRINAVKFDHLEHLTPAVRFLSLRIGLALTEPPQPKDSKKINKQLSDIQARTFACKQAAHQLWIDHIRPAVNRTEVIPEEFKVSFALRYKSLFPTLVLIGIIRSPNWKPLSIRLRSQDYPLPNITSELHSMQMISTSCGQRFRMSSTRRKNSGTVTSLNLIGWPW